VPESRIIVLDPEIAEKLVKMIENCIEEGIGLEKPGFAWKAADGRDFIQTLKYLYGLGNVFF
jgi:hypothetical protein